LWKRQKVQEVLRQGGGVVSAKHFPAQKSRVARFKDNWQRFYLRLFYMEGEKYVR
jgi:hypothetical protein